MASTTAEPFERTELARIPAVLAPAYPCERRTSSPVILAVHSHSRSTRTQGNTASRSASRRRCIHGHTVRIGIGGQAHNNALNTRTRAGSSTSRTPLERRATTDFPGPATKQRLPTPVRRPLPPRPVPAALGAAAAASSTVHRRPLACIHASCSNSSQAGLSEGFHCNVLVTHAETR